MPSERRVGAVGEIGAESRPGPALLGPIAEPRESARATIERLGDERSALHLPEVVIKLAQRRARQPVAEQEPAEGDRRQGRLSRGRKLALQAAVELGRPCPIAPLPRLRRLLQDRGGRGGCFDRPGARLESGVLRWPRARADRRRGREGERLLPRGRRRRRGRSRRRERAATIGPTGAGRRHHQTAALAEPQKTISAAAAPRARRRTAGRRRAPGRPALAMPATRTPPSTQLRARSARARMRAPS